MKRAEPAVRDLFRYRDGIGRGVHVTQQGQVTHREPGADQPLPLDRPGVRRRHRHAEEEFRVGEASPSAQKPPSAAGLNQASAVEKSSPVARSRG